jgi:hypothetical protein
LNAIQSVGVTAPLQVTLYTADSTRPTVVSYVLDMVDRVIVLTFSESVKLDTIRIGELCW